MIYDRKDVEAADAEKVDLALEAIRQNDFSTARRLLKAAIVNAPEEYIYQYEESNQLFIKFWDEDEFLHYVTGRKDLEDKKNVFWTKSAYPRAYFFLAFIDNEEGNDESAFAHLKASLKLEPDQPISYCEMATIYSRMRQHEKALSLYEQALQARSYVPSKIRARALRGKGIELIELGDLNLAKRCLIESLYFDPNNELALEELFYIHLLLTGEPNVLTSPPPLQLKRAKTSGKIRCISCGKELMSGLEDECKALNVKGKIIHICTSCATNETYKEAISIKYILGGVYYEKGLEYANLGKFMDAVEAFKKVIAEEKDHVEAHFSLGCAYLELEKYQEAIEAFTEAIRIKPDFDKAYYCMGDAYSHLENYKEAMDRYKQAIQLRPEYAEAHFSLGVAYRMMGLYEEAIEEFRKAVQIKPDYRDPYSILGWVLNELGRYEEAINAYKEGLRIDSDDLSSRYQLGLIYLTIGDKESALQEYEFMKKHDEEIAKELLKEICK